MATKKNENLFFTYKEKPLVANGNTIYYGDPSQKYILVLQVTDSKAIEDLTVATRVNMSLMLTDPNVSLKDKIIKSAQKESVASALEVGMIWLDRALKK